MEPRLVSSNVYCVHSCFFFLQYKKYKGKRHMVPSKFVDHNPHEIWTFMEEMEELKVTT